jgi:hypothetical protein
MMLLVCLHPQITLSTLSLQLQHTRVVALIVQAARHLTKAMLLFVHTYTNTKKTDYTCNAAMSYTQTPKYAPFIFL